MNSIRAAARLAEQPAAARQARRAQRGFDGTPRAVVREVRSSWLLVKRRAFAQCGAQCTHIWSKSNRFAMRPTRLAHTSAANRAVADRRRRRVTTNRQSSCRPNRRERAAIRVAYRPARPGRSSLSTRGHQHNRKTSARSAGCESEAAIAREKLGHACHDAGDAVGIPIRSLLPCSSARVDVDRRRAPA